MNGRIYDPKLGRFLQADPFVQDAKNSQSLNRYTYVYNNPLSYTDPSGYFSLKSLWKKIRPFAAIALSIYMPQFGALWHTLGVAGNAIAIGAITGGVAGFVASGSISGALAGAFAGAALGALHGWSPGSSLAKAGKALAHGAVGGLQNVIQGARFGHGFLSAGFAQSLSGPIGAIREVELRVLAAAVAGGTISEVTGGKFANGAVTGAFSRALNEELSARKDNQAVRTLSKKQALALSNASKQYLEDIYDLTPEQFEARFPEVKELYSLFGDRASAVSAAQTQLRDYLFPMWSESAAKFMSEHAIDSLDSALQDILFGGSIKAFNSVAGGAWDIYSVTNSSSILWTTPDVVIACHVNSGCKFAIE